MPLASSTRTVTAKGAPALVVVWLVDTMNEAGVPSGGKTICSRTELGYTTLENQRLPSGPTVAVWKPAGSGTGSGYKVTTPLVVMRTKSDAPGTLLNSASVKLQRLPSGPLTRPGPTMFDSGN